MTDVFDEFFRADDGPTRDRWGRPLLIPRDGGPEDRKPYTRASSLGDKLSDFSHLHTWEKRYLARGMALRPDICRLVASEPYTTGFDRGDLRENRASGKRIDEQIERALEAVKIHEKADYGTAVHARTEPGNDGTDWDEMQRTEVDAFWAMIRESGIVLIGTEVFTANDELSCAGTFDHLMYIPAVGIVIGDKKTSSEPHEDYDVQLANYANSDVYDYTNDSRQTLEEYVASRGWDPALLRRDIGYLIWIKNGKATLHPLDLVAGYQAARTAAWVRDVHHKKGKAKDVTAEIIATTNEQRAKLLLAIQSAPDVATLNRLWGHPASQAIWTDDHTAAAAARKGQL